MSATCCDRIGQRTRYISRGRTMLLCSRCLEAVLYAENQHRTEGDDALSRLASYFTPEG